MTLTDLTIRKLKPKEERYEVLDNDGLAIRVLPSGKKSWTFRYSFDGEQKRITLGKYPAVSIPDARLKQALAVKDIEAGIDPATKAQNAKLKRIEAPTFDDLLDEYWKLELSKTPTAKDRRRLVEKDVLPAWKKLKVTEIRRRDAVLLLDKVRERAPITANRLQSVLVRMFNFASERDMIDFSPMGGMRHGKEKARSRVLTDDEIKTLWNCLDLENTKIDIFRVNKLALKAILLTGQRPGEVCSMKKDQIENGFWIIPGEERKNSEENRVPILPLFADIIKQAEVYNQDSNYVFPSSHSFPTKRGNKKGIKPVGRLSLSNALRRHRDEMKVDERFTPHDLRRTLRTRLAELGISDIVAERVLGHKLQGIMAVYNRHSYDTEKRQALDAWEKRLIEIVGATESDKNKNVIPFKVCHAKK